MDLFAYGARQEKEEQAPLARRMRPRNLEEFQGQEHLLAPGRPLRRSIEADRLVALVFWGPPGSGKTALAEIISNYTRAHFARLNAVMSGVADIRRVVEEAGERLGGYGQRTVLFIDEVHRFHKGQQDALLPYVEDGTVILIGATTENPMFELIPPLVSRSQIMRFYPLNDRELLNIMQIALEDRQRGLGALPLEVSPEAREHLARVADGDARRALNALELATLTTRADADGVVRVGLPEAADSVQQKPLSYGRAGDQHYDTVSAFIKSMRGSDPDATLYWLARMIHAGEDPRFLARRMLILAAEDVGLADPHALVITRAAAQAADFVGWPEARLPLAQAALYLATAPKSNSVITAIDRALQYVKEETAPPVPPHLRDSSYSGAKALGHGQEYRYPHDEPEAYSPQEYLPEELAATSFYRPSPRGYEARIRAFLQHLQELRQEN